MKHFAVFCRNIECKPLVTAVTFALKIRANPSQIGISCFSVSVITHKIDIVVSAAAFIKPSGRDTKIDDFMVNASPGKIANGMGCIPAPLRKKQHLGCALFRGTLIGWRLNCYLSHDHLNRFNERYFPDFDQIVQSCPTANATGKPAPFAIGDFEAVMGSGAISASTKMHQFTWLIVFQIGQQVHLFGLCNDLRWNIWHKNPPFHSHELTARKQSGYVKGPAGSPNRPRAVIALYPLFSFVFVLRTWLDPLRSARCPPYSPFLCAPNP